MVGTFVSKDGADERGCVMVGMVGMGWFVEGGRVVTTDFADEVWG